MEVCCFSSCKVTFSSNINCSCTYIGIVDISANCIISSFFKRQSSSTIYYKTVSVKDISVYIYVGGRTPGEINSVEMNGCTPYVGEKALPAVKINNQSAGAPKFTLSGNWLIYTFANVTKVSNITCARDGGNIFTGEITDNVYYSYDGTSLPSQCVSRDNPTWGTAPASGAVGGSMTASVTAAVLRSICSFLIIVYTSSCNFILTDHCLSLTAYQHCCYEHNITKTLLSRNHVMWYSVTV